MPPILRSVVAQCYRRGGGRSIGSRNFSSSPPGSSTNGKKALWFRLKCIKFSRLGFRYASFDFLFCCCHLCVIVESNGERTTVALIVRRGVAVAVGYGLGLERDFITLGIFLELIISLWFNFLFCFCAKVLYYWAILQRSMRRSGKRWKQKSISTWIKV